MPNWNTLTVADLNDHKIAELVEALRTEALGDGQPDPMPGIIVEVTNELRGAIAFSGRYTLDVNLTALPNMLREVASKKIVRVLKGRLELPLSKDEQVDAEIYESRLKALVAGTWPIDQPDTPLNPVVVAQTVAASPRITSRTRTFRRSDGDGI